MMLIINTKNLTQEELDLLSSLTEGFKVKETKLKTKPCKQELEPYYLEVITTCTTCNEEHFQTFKMSWSKDKNALVSEEVHCVKIDSFAPEPERRQTRFCSKCKINLSKLPTDKLVDMLLEARKLS